MRKVATFLSAAVCSVLILGCQENASQKNNEHPISDIVYDIKEQVSEELKKAFAVQIEEFFQNQDLESTLGINNEELNGIESSIKNYINHYNMDEEKLREAKKSVEELLENAKGLSAQEIQDKIAEVFEQSNE